MWVLLVQIQHPNSQFTQSQKLRLKTENNFGKSIKFKLAYTVSLGWPSMKYWQLIRDKETTNN